ncbi:ABC transporter ATP-binding protein [Nocardia sp. NPDC050710]|uniref:ABC transporter ATP-binding protein n=1 Tax=Nocardia sp. NPDC050710 TaxID=3157220 RepID=UPI0033F451FC
MTLLRATGLSLNFGGTRALSDISFEVTEGELLAVIGPNGAGKTSLFNCLSGVYRPQHGSITLAGETMTGRAPDAIARLGIARMFQNIELFDNLTVLDNIKLGRHLHLRYGPVAAALRLPKARREELAARLYAEGLIEFLELQQVRDHPVGLLPYGVKKRVELARALAMEPRLLLLDEPVAGMNVEETTDMARFILDVRTDLELAMIMVEHDMRLVMDLADRIMVLDFGERIALGTPSQVRTDPRVIAAYLGTGDSPSDSGAAVLEANP